MSGRTEGDSIGKFQESQQLRMAGGDERETKTVESRPEPEPINKGEKGDQEKAVLTRKFQKSRKTTRHVAYLSRIQKMIQKLRTEKRKTEIDEESASKQIRI